jgi:hypothetical protein
LYQMGVERRRAVAVLDEQVVMVGAIRVVLGVVILFQDVSGWILEKIARDLSQAQKGNSYKF